MALLLKNAHVVDPSVELDGVVDVLIDGDKIAEVARISPSREPRSATFPASTSSLAWWICTFTFASPAMRSKRTSRAVPRSCQGRLTGVCSMPNTDPVTDNGTVVEFVKSRAARSVTAASIRRAP